MEFFYSAELTIPLMQIILLLTLSTLALLFGRVKLALMTNYIFALYWGYFLNRDLLSDFSTNNGEHFMFIYFGLGIGLTVLALIGFFFSKH